MTKKHKLMMILLAFSLSVLAIVVCVKSFSINPNKNLVQSQYKNLVQSQFEHALHNDSTAPNYILISVWDRTIEKMEKKQICVEAPYFLSALQRKLELKDDQWSAVIKKALEQKDKTYELDIKCNYTQEMVDEVRKIIAGHNEKEIDELVNKSESPLRALLKRSGPNYNYLEAIAHALSERGILCGRCCEYAWIYIDDWKENQTSTYDKELSDETSTIVY
jgi:hypothetical protein